jgi:hypothetical protein
VVHRKREGAMEVKEGDANRETLEQLWSPSGFLSADEEYERRGPDFVMEMPQSGERVVGRDNMREMQRTIGTPPKARVTRIVGSGDLFVVQAMAEYADGRLFHVAVIVEFEDGLIARETRYYAEPFDAAPARAELVERIEMEGQ